MTYDSSLLHQLRIPAIFMRGGTSKGVFFLADDLPADPVERDRVLLRIIGSPDPYRKQIDGMGGATSSTSKVVVVSRSQRADSDVDYLFGAVSVDRPIIDWSGNCGNLSAAVGPYAIHRGLVAAPPNGTATVRIWQLNIRRRILAQVPMVDGQVQETGPFMLDGVAFPAAEIPLSFVDPAGGSTELDSGALFPTGLQQQSLVVPGVGEIAVSFIDAGNPTIFIHAADLGLKGTELPAEVNANAEILQRAEAIRAAGAVAMGLAQTSADATVNRPHTPKLMLLAEPAGYIASDGRAVAATDIQLTARIFSMGQLHHAMTGTGAVALAAAAAIPGTLVRAIMQRRRDGELVFGHPSGTLRVAAGVNQADGNWHVDQVTMSRTARILMEGWVRVPRG